MANFNQLIKKLDKGNILGSIKDLSLQCQQAWDEVKKIKLPSAYKNIENIVVCGMGGSNIGTDFLRNVFYREIKYPVLIVNDYQLPGYVSSKSLVIISSYSGNTEESLFGLKEAQKRKSKIIIITAGGKLVHIARRKKIPAYIFAPIHNSSNQPRMGLGYSIMGQLCLLKKLNLVKVEGKEIQKAIADLPKTKVEEKAKILAQKIYQKMPIIVGAEFLSGNAHILANQINENAKNFADYFLLPELNHHLMEGLKFPSKKIIIFLFLESKNYSKVIKKRIAVTKQVLNKAKLRHLSYNTFGKGKLSEGLEVLSAGSYISFYLSLLNNINPSAIPTVDYFKKELAM